MKKYMGNKSRILPEIYKAAKLAPKNCTLFDAFAGTTNVGQYFKARGYKIISNDVNATSRLMGDVYLKLNTLPSFDTLFSSDCYTINHLNELINTEDFEEKKELFMLLNRNTNDESYLKDVYNSHAFNLLVYLSFYASQTDFEDKCYSYELKAPDFIWRNFCVKGTHSEYFNLVSQKSIISQITSLQKYLDKYGENSVIEKCIVLLRSVYTPPFQINNLSKAIELLNANSGNFSNTSSIEKITTKLTALTKRKNHIGNRMFFSEVHGHIIDTINNLSLLWLKDKLISDDEYNFIQCSLVEAVALFSNTSATYQAFYKTYRANTLQQFRLVFPEIIASSNEHSVYCEDTFELIKTLPEQYDILYLDPPYNWRIYDSNYHLLNLLSDYSNLSDDIISYESGIAGAAGENRNLTREYTNYNRRNTFEDLLFELILSSKCKYVILSYSDSLSNHNKNSLSSVEKIEAFFKNDKYFAKDSFKKIELSSVNFESRKSEKKEGIHELLFIAERNE